MSISLWVLVDNVGRIYYSGGSRSLVQDHQGKLDVSVGNTYIIELKGEI